MNRHEIENRIDYLKTKKWSAITANLRYQEIPKRMSNIFYLIYLERIKIDDIPTDDLAELAEVVKNMFEEFVARGNPYRIIDLPLPKPEKARYCCSHLHDRSNESWTPVNRIAH